MRRTAAPQVRTFDNGVANAGRTTSAAGRDSSTSYEYLGDPGASNTFALASAASDVGDRRAGRSYMSASIRSWRWSLVLVVLVMVGCGGAQRPPLSYAESCAENGLILGGTRAAEAGGVIGSVFAAGGNTHSCERPATAQHYCEVQSNAQAAIVKRTYDAEPAQVLAYANQVRWHYYNQCMTPTQTAPATPPATEPAPAPAAVGAVAPAPSR